MQPISITLKELAETDFIFGSTAGALVLDKLQKLKIQPGSVLEVDFSGMRVVDACFIRDSLAAYVKLNCENIGLFVSNLENVDVVENTAIGFKAKGLPMLMKSSDGSGTVIADYPASLRVLIRNVYSKAEITSRQLAIELDVSSPNASAKLKKLFSLGLLLGKKVQAESGGHEYLYLPYFVSNEIRIFKS